MAADWETCLARWAAAGLVDADGAGRIRAWESEHARSQGWRWPVWFALAFGVLLVGAGILLFVSAHWDELSAAQRMALVVLLVGGFHAAGAAAAGRCDALSVAFHAVGTLALGAGIALAGQIFNLSEHWPSAILLWALGAGLAWALLGHWTQGALTAILVPYWLAGEGWERAAPFSSHPAFVPIVAGVCALSFTYLSARRTANDSPLRKALGWLGGLALPPAVFFTAFAGSDFRGQMFPWLIATLGPLALAWVLRGRGAVWNLIAVAWTLFLAAISDGHPDHVAVYLWGAIGSVGLVAWGILESRAERINLGSAGFALTVLCFYFSTVLDKLGRSASLVTLGILFLGGGWLLERLRRKLVAQIRPEAI